VLSVVISILAAYAARATFERVVEARGRSRLAWIVGGAATDGIGTWSMHYTGMSALLLPVALRFDWRTVVASLLIGIAGSGVAVAVMARGRAGWARLLLGGVVLGGLGISGLHFSAMTALLLQGMHHHHVLPGRVAFSVIVAVFVSALALAATFQTAEDDPGRGLRRHGGALLRGVANPAMHYTAMSAVVFVFTTEPVDLTHAVGIASLGVVGVSVVPVIVLLVALLTSLADRLQRQKVLLDELFETAPQAVALTTAGDRIVRVNREFTRLFGHPAAAARGRLLSELVVPEDARRDGQHYAEVTALGERVELETLLQRGDGSRFHASMVRVPVTVPGGRIETYAIYGDITERRKAEEALRAYPRRLVETQEAERRRVARELHDEIGQLLTGIGLMLSHSEKQPPDQAKAGVAAARSLLDELIGRVQRLALDLRPAVLDDLGLVPALLWLVDRYTAQTGVRVDFKQGGLEGRRLAAETETAAYRIVQEALTNVARHSRAAEAAVRILVRDDTLEVQVEDQGRGFDPRRVEGPAQSAGLAGMRERAHMLGGRLTIESAPGAGTRIVATLPLAARGEAG
jgi:PAS domain S-box-containing protein